MAFTQSDLDAIDRCIAMVALTVKFSDHTVTYMSLREMKEARKFIYNALYGPADRQIFIVGRKGY